MGVRRVGVQLVAQDADKYINDVERAEGSTDKFTKTLKTLGAAVGGLAIGRALVGVARDALGAIASYEQLSMSMSSLVAKELRTADATLSVSDAMEQATGRAGELLKWIQDLAIKSPFSQEGVALAFRTALAYGFTSDEAQRLTAATIDFATATGQSVGVMNQVALALGQIKAKGKLAGQEILQLVNAGFSVRPILESLGYTMDDVSKGLVTSDKFLSEFVKTLESDFGGAASRSANTVNGLLDSLNDLKQIGLRELFAPVVEQTLLPILSGMVSKFQELMPVIAMVGRGIAGFTTFLIENRQTVLTAAVALGTFWAVMNAGTIITAVTTGIGLLSSAIVGLVGAVGLVLSPLGLLATAAAVIVGGLFSMRREFAQTTAGVTAGAGQIDRDVGVMSDNIGQRLDDTGQRAHGWGYNLIMQFANGMAAAISAVLNVLTQLANAIAGWLAPGSPPRLLPDIDEWGAGAMDSYLQGWTSADFGILQDLSRPIEQFLRSQATSGDTGLVDSIRQARQALAEAVAEFKNTGQISADTLSQFEPAVQGYISAMFEAESAANAVRQAQDALNEITERYDAILNPLNDELDAIGRRRQEIIDEQRKTQLEAIISDANAPAMAKELAQMELREIQLKQQISATELQKQAETDQAQSALDNANTQLDAAQEQLAAQQALLDIQTQDNQLLAEQASLLEQLAAGAGAAASSLGQAGSALQQLAAGGGLGGLAQSLGTITNSFETFAEDLKKPFANIKGQFDELKAAWALVGLNFIAKLQPVTTYLFTQWGPGGTWSGNIALLKIMAGQLKEKWDSTMNDIRVALNEAGAFVQEEWGAGGTWEGNMDLLKTAVGLLSDRWNEVWGEDGVFHGIIQFASDYLTEQWGEGGTWHGIFDLLGTAMDSLRTLVLKPFEKGLDAIRTAAQWLYDQLKNLLDLIANADLSSLWPFISQSPAPMALGLQQINRQMRQFAQTELPMLQRSVSLSVPMTQGQVAASYNTTSVRHEYNLGGNSINNGMDMAQFEAAVLRVVNRAVEDR